MSNCDNECSSTSGPNFDGNNSNTNKDPNCVTTNVGNCPPTQECSPWQLSKSNDACIINEYNNQALNIAGADMVVYKLLGIHEQEKLVDATGLGKPLSSGDRPLFPVSNAFDKYQSEWRSVQKGAGVVASAYIGYDFGEIKTSDRTRNMYGNNTSIFKHITAISIKQSPLSQNRITKARIERSDDNLKWYGTAIITLPDDDCLNTLLFDRHSFLSRYWRIRPLDFNGGEIDYWGVVALQLHHNYIATNTNNIQDLVFLENRDRDYADEPMVLKCYYDLVDITTELSKFGIELPSQSFYITINFSACVANLGRPIIIGDIIELPSEAQYNTMMQPIKKWLEVIDVGWSTEGFTPGWKPTLLKVVAQPAFASQETQDIFGDLSESFVDSLGLMNTSPGNNPNYQDYLDVNGTITNLAKEMVPELGTEASSHIREWEQHEIDSFKAQTPEGSDSLQKIGLNRAGLYAEDAMPPNNLPYTEGDGYPPNPKNGDYHRLTYSTLDIQVAPRLYRYSGAKSRWIYLETDRRLEFNADKPKLEEFLNFKNK
jgi:hypothetical protein